MTNPKEILPGVIFYAYLTETRKEKVGFFEHNTLVLQVSGHFKLETAAHSITMRKGEVLLVGKNQLGQITKTPLQGENYETIVISLQEDMLRQIALEEKIETTDKYMGPPNIHIPDNEFLKAYFQSIVPYARHPIESLTSEVGLLKVKESVKLLLHIMPSLKTFLFGFPEPYKINLEKFMLNNFSYNIPLERFAQLTGRSLATFKRDFKSTFNTSPRKWLQEQRLQKAKVLIEQKQLKPSDIYNDLGFETLAHFSSSFKKKFGVAPSKWSL